MKYSIRYKGQKLSCIEISELVGGCSSQTVRYWIRERKCTTIADIRRMVAGGNKNPVAMKDTCRGVLSVRQITEQTDACHGGVVHARSRIYGWKSEAIFLPYNLEYMRFKELRLGLGILTLRETKLNNGALVYAPVKKKKKVGRTNTDMLRKLNSIPVGTWER